MANTPVELNLANIGGGDLMECASHELRKICQNIADPNVKTSAKRKLNISIEIKPDETGQMAQIAYTVKSAMPGPDSGKTMAYIAVSPEGREISLFEVERHPNLFEEKPIPGIEPLSIAKQA